MPHTPSTAQAADTARLADILIEQLDDAAQAAALSAADTAGSRLRQMPPPGLTGDVRPGQSPAADSAAQALVDSLREAWRLRAWDKRVIVEPMSPATRFSEGGDGRLMTYQTGLPPFNRAPVAGYDSGVMTVVLTVVLAIGVASRHASTFIKNFAKSLFKPRRESIFDDHTVSETRIQAALVTLLCVAEGTIAYTSLRYAGVLPPTVFLPMMACIGAAGLYYLWQLAAYNLVGYTFTSRTGRIQWVKGFNASQILLGLTLVVPMLVALFYPRWGRLVMFLAIILYIVARLIFIARGFRVFYKDFGSILYFILYLCALEIAPPVLILKLRFLLA